MTDRPLITHERLLEVLSYDPETGEFRWRVKPTARMSIGDRAGAITGKKGTQYITIWVDMAPYKAHRLAWLYMTGEWPKEQIDHINVVGTDNRFANLREATQSQNQHNVGLRKDSTSGFKGVSFDKNRGLWRARIMVFGNTKFIGYFATAEDAAKSRVEMAIKVHGSFARS